MSFIALQDFAIQGFGFKEGELLNEIEGVDFDSLIALGYIEPSTKKVKDK
jgi:hypothetical protein